MNPDTHVSAREYSTAGYQKNGKSVNVLYIPLFVVDVLNKVVCKTVLFVCSFHGVPYKNKNKNKNIWTSVFQKRGLFNDQRVVTEGDQCLQLVLFYRKKNRRKYEFDLSQYSTFVACLWLASFSCRSTPHPVGEASWASCQRQPNQES